jgi:tripeptide aminopeptidase
MTMAEYLHNHPKFMHNDIVVAFTPDEEIGQGTAHFDLERFGADYAYTIDGGPIDEINFENFNAYKAEVEVEGHSYHTGSAKGKMVNAITVARHFDELLGEHDRPEYTEGYEGFIHLGNIAGDVSHTSLSYIVREHDAEKIKRLLDRMSDAAAYLNKQLGEELIHVTFTKQYENMKPVIEKYPQIVDQVSEAMLDVGITPRSIPIRGGTDGALLSLRGLPTPNLGTGGYNYHGPYEYASLTDMKKVVELLLAIIRNNTKNIL